MIAVMMMAQAALLGPIGQQALPARGCAVYLWSPVTRALVAMASADPGTLRIALDGAAPADLARVDEASVEAFGFAAQTRYRRGDTAVTLDQTVNPRSDLTQGAMVPQATLTIDRAGHDSVVLPVAGIIGCSATPG